MANHEGEIDACRAESTLQEWLERPRKVLKFE